MIERIRRNQLFQLTISHARELIREPGVLFWGIIFPILMSLGLGIAFTRKADVIRNVAVVTVAGDPAGEKGELSHIRQFLYDHHAAGAVTDQSKLAYRLTIPDDKLGNTTFLFETITRDKAMVLLKRGYYNVILKDSAGRISYEFDPLNSDAQLTYLKLTALFMNPEILKKRSHEEIRPLTLRGTRYVDFLIPGLISMGVMMSIMWGISYEIIDTRSKKLLRRMVATPMKKSNYLIALIAVRILMNFVEAGLLLLFSWLAFGISIQGNIGALLTIFMAGNIVFAGIAILTSSHTSKTEIGNGLINFVVTPMMVLSGIFFSYHNFPDWAIPFIKLLPLTMLADGVRSIFIEGAGFAEIAMSSLVMTLTGILFFIAGLRIFKWN